MATSVAVKVPQIGGRIALVAPWAEVASAMKSQLSKELRESNLQSRRPPALENETMRHRDWYACRYRNPEESVIFDWHLRKCHPVLGFVRSTFNPQVFHSEACNWLPLG